MVAKHSEGSVLVHRVALHQDPLGALGDRPTHERTFQIVVLGEPAQHDVDRALPVPGVGVGDVGEDARCDASLTKRGSGAWMRRITGHAASWTIFSIRPSA